jgi:hypothetical protein
MNLYEYCGDDPVTHAAWMGDDIDLDKPTPPWKVPGEEQPSDEAKPLHPGGHDVLKPDGSVGSGGPVSPGVEIPHYTPGKIEAIKPAIKPFTPKPVKGYRKCVKWGPSLADQLGMTNDQCAMYVLSLRPVVGAPYMWPKNCAASIGGFFIHPYIGLGIALGNLISYGMAHMECSMAPCIQWVWVDTPKKSCHIIIENNRPVTVCDE